MDATLPYKILNESVTATTKNSAPSLFRKEAKWVASLDPKATPDEKDAIKKAIW